MKNSSEYNSKCRIKKIFFFSLAFFIHTVFCYSSDLRFEHITSENGLAGNSVSSIIQDIRGFLWFGTQDGLNRYDGKTFRLYEHEPFNTDSLQHNLVQTMYYDSDLDIIWIGTYGGLSSFDPKSEKIKHYALSDEQNSKKQFSRVIVSIEKDKNGIMWIGTLSGLVSLDPATGKTSEYVNIEGNTYSLPDNSVRDLLYSSDGKLWAATYKGLAYFEDGRFYRIKKEKLENYFPSDYIMDIEEVDKGIYLVGSWEGGISLFNENENRVENIKFPDNKIYFIKKDNNNHIWTGTWGGGLYYSENVTALLNSEYKIIKKDESNKYSLSNNIGYSFLNDSSGLIWIGTNGGGINKLNPEVNDYRYLYSSLKTNHKLPDERIKSTFIDKKGLLWLGSYSNGIYRYNEKNKSFKRFFHDKNNSRSLSNNFVNKIFSDSSDNIWVATNSGINRFISETGGFEHFYFNGEKIVKKSRDTEFKDNPEFDIIYSVFEDVKGRLWIGTYLNGVYIWDRKEDKTLHLYPGAGAGFSISDQMIYDIKDDKYGNIWIGTNHGLNVYDINKKEVKTFLYNPEVTEGIPDNVVIRIFKDSSDEMWIGTSGGGLSRYDYSTGNFFHYTKNNGLFSNSVTGISEDMRGNIVVTTNTGLSIVNRIKNQIYNISYQFGLNDVSLKGDIIKDKKGDFYISTTGVVYKINTENYYIRDFEPEVVISDFRVFDGDYRFAEGKSIFNPGVIKLPWNDNSFSFNFVSLDYTSPFNNRYEYILEGFDRGWISSGTRNYVNYTNMSPGKYIFRVKGSNSSGKWSSSESSVRIVISPPPYLSLYAYILYAAAVFTIFYAVVMIVRGRESVKRLKEENRLKNKLIIVNSELDRLVRIDSLTGVYNRLHFKETLENGWHLYKRLDITLSLIMTDIDFFKNYNDTYGHVAGDECLKIFSDIMNEAVSRKTDTVFRYGGEEFIIILLDTGLEGASVVAEKIMEILAERKIRNSGSSVSEYLTASIGIVSTDKVEYESSDEMIIDVDKKLYLAKEHGRDTVIC